MNTQETKIIVAQSLSSGVSQSLSVLPLAGEAPLEAFEKEVKKVFGKECSLCYPLLDGPDTDFKVLGYTLTTKGEIVSVNVLGIYRAPVSLSQFTHTFSDALI